jgi:hypothetical protein
LRSGQLFSDTQPQPMQSPTWSRNAVSRRMRSSRSLCQRRDSRSQSAAQVARPLGKVASADLVIDERHGMKIVDGLLTGFHAADATHQWILRAFLSADLVQSAYAEAAQKRSNGTTSATCI